MNCIMQQKIYKFLCKETVIDVSHKLLGIRCVMFRIYLQSMTKGNAGHLVVSLSFQYDMQDAIF